MAATSVALSVGFAAQIAGLDLVLYQRSPDGGLVVLDRIEHAQRGEAVHVFIAEQGRLTAEAREAEIIKRHRKQLAAEGRQVLKVSALP